MNYWNKEIECAPRSEIEALQSYRLSRTIRRVYENVAPYRKKMDEAGVRPEDIKSIADLSKLPLQRSRISETITLTVCLPYQAQRS